MTTWRSSAAAACWSVSSWTRPACSRRASRGGVIARTRASAAPTRSRANVSCCTSAALFPVSLKLRNAWSIWPDEPTRPASARSTRSMYALTASRRFVSWLLPPQPASRRAATRTTPQRATGTDLLEQLDGGDAAVGVPEDELDEALAGREPGLPGAAPVRELALAQCRDDGDRVERPGRHLHRLHAEHLRAARHAVGREVAARLAGLPRVAGGRVRRQDRVEAERHQVERRHHVPPVRRRGERRPERRELELRRRLRVPPEVRDAVETLRETVRACDLDRPRHVLDREAGRPVDDGVDLDLLHLGLLQVLRVRPPVRERLALREREVVEVGRGRRR